MIAAQQQATEQALKFTACMRSHGLPTFPEPIVSAHGIEVHFGGHRVPRPSSPQFQAAQRACQRLMPSGTP